MADPLTSVAVSSLDFATVVAGGFACAVRDGEGGTPDCVIPVDATPGESTGLLNRAEAKAGDFLDGTVLLL